MDVQVDTLKKMHDIPGRLLSFLYVYHFSLHQPLVHSNTSLLSLCLLYSPPGASCCTSSSSIPGSPLYYPFVTFARVIILTRCSHIGADALNLSAEHSQGVYLCHFTSKSVDKQVNGVFYLASGLTLAVLLAVANLYINENLSITIIQ